MTLTAVAAWLRRLRWWVVAAAFALSMALDLAPGLAWGSAALFPAVIVLVFWIPAIDTAVASFRRGYNDHP